MGEPIQGDDDEPEEPSLVVDEMAAPEQWEEPELEGFLREDESVQERAAETQSS